jgi:hypothetical protein
VANLLLDEHDIASILSQPTHIVETAFDGGFNPSMGISSYGWTGAMNKTPTAVLGCRATAAHPDLAELVWAEGYGLAAAASIIT